MASGFDYSSKQPFRLQQGRLGIYDKSPFKGSPVEGVNYTAVRLGQMGGNRQQERMILSKRRSLDRAVWNSYQAAEIIKQDAEYKKPIRCLINPNKLKQDYDDKTLSVGNEYQFKPGDIFEWCGTNTYWICYLQDLTELAYFRGDIRKCSYKINWVDEGEKKSTYAAIRGPVETKINYIQKHEISVDNPNYSLNILMPKNEDTLKYFRRYTKFYLDSQDKGDNLICWRVEAVDSISMPGILEINATEYYINEQEDNLEDKTVGSLIAESIDPNPTTTDIIGETFIFPKKTYTYYFDGEVVLEWKIKNNKKLPVSLKIIKETKKPTVEISWTSGYSGQFDLLYGDYKKTIIVQSLF